MPLRIGKSLLPMWIQKAANSTTESSAPKFTGTTLRIVVGDPFADGLPRRFNGLKGLDVDGARQRKT
jgi:hypothetical protein